MPDAIVYCSQCNRMVTPDEIRTNIAIVTPTVAVCAACCALLTPEERAALARAGSAHIAEPDAHETRPSRATPRPRSQTSTLRRASIRRRTGRLPQTDEEEPVGTKSKAGMVIMAGLVGLLLVGVLVFMFQPDEKPKDESKPPPPLAMAPAPGSPAAPAPDSAAPAARGTEGVTDEEPGKDTQAAAAKEKRLDDIRWLVDPSMGKYHDIQKRLDAFLADFPGDAEALKLRSEVDRTFAAAADEALSAAVDHAATLAGRGDKDQAVRGIRSVAARFGDSEWYRTKGEKAIRKAIDSVGAGGAVEPPRRETASSGPRRDRPDRAAAAGAEEKPSGTDEIRAAREAIAAGDLGKARELLAGRDTWRDRDRERADALIDIIAEAEARAAELERERGDPWARFLLTFNEAGKKGLPQAKAFFEREAKGLRGAGLGDEVSRMRRLVREADLIDSLVTDALLSSGRSVRFVIGDRRVAGRVQAIEDGVIKLKTSVGKEEKVKLTDIPPADLVEKARLKRLGAVSDYQLAAYFFTLGDLEAAQKAAAGLSGEGAPGLRADIEKLRSLSARAVAGIELPEEEEAGPADAADDADPAAGGGPSEEADAPTVVEPPPGGWPKEPLPGETGKPGQWAPGLITEIFSGQDFKNRVAVRIDPNLDYGFGSVGADLDMNGDMFSMRWTGWLLLPHEGRYAFEASADDELSVTMDGRPLVNRQRAKAPQRRYLAGLHPIIAEYKKGAQNAWLQLKWSGPTIEAGPIPSDYFYHEVPKLGEYGPPAKLMHGLWAEYYADEDFRRLVAEGPVDTLNLDIGKLPPHPRCPQRKFGIRMRGYVLLSETKEYAFAIKDVAPGGGVKLTIGDQMIFNTVLMRGEKQELKRKMDAGYHEIVCEYVGGTGEARLNIDLGGWNTPGVCESRLYQKARQLAPVERSGMAPGMTNFFYAGPKPGAGRPVIKTYSPAARLAWRGGSPAPDVPTDRFSGVWRGFLLVPRSGKYLFRAKVKGGVVFSIGRKKVITTGRDTNVESKKDGAIPLRAGPVPVLITYSEANGDPGMEFQWAGPGFGFRRLAGGSLAHRARELDIAEPLPEEPAAPTEVAAGGGAVPRGGGREAAGRAKAKEKKEPLPEGNLVGNGGFEVIGPDNFPQGWAKRDWGKGGKYSVRRDKTNPHGDSKYSLRIRPVDKGGKPGAFANVRSLPPGRYEVRFWACSDAEETAKVHVRLGERELHWAMATDDWRQIKHTFEVTEKQIGATLGLYTSTAVLVWFDDVELEAAEVQD